MGIVSKSDNGFQSSTFAPIWATLHMVSLNFPTHPTAEDKYNYKQFVLSLQHVLPCRSCRESFRDITHHGKLRLLNKHLASRAALARWVFDVHNEVSTRIGKPKYPGTFAEVCQQYELSRAQSCKDHGCVAVDGAKRKAVVTFKSAAGSQVGIVHIPPASASKRR